MPYAHLPCNLVHLSTAAASNAVPRPWVKIQSAGWVRFQSAPTPSATFSPPCRRACACVISATLPSVPTTVWTNPLAMSTPTCAFMPQRRVFRVVRQQRCHQRRPWGSPRQSQPKSARGALAWSSEPDSAWQWAGVVPRALLKCPRARLARWRPLFGRFIHVIGKVAPSEACGTSKIAHLDHPGLPPMATT